jgi:Cd2+/Zn2+-exporting ATPase
MREYLLLGVSGVCLALGIIAETLSWPAAVTVSLFAAAILAGAVEIVPAGIRGVFRERSLDINFLVTVAVAGAVALGQWSEAATVVFLFTLGETLEDYTLARTRRSIQALMAMAPETAQLKLPDGAERTVPVEAVPVGSVVAVRPGDRIPLDGVVVAGESSVDQAPITGESLPADMLPGDTVYAGTINRTGYLEVRSSKPFAENTLARIIHLVESAQAQKAPSQQFVERFARVYTPAVVLGAVLLTAIPPLLFGEPLIPWFNRALVLLIVACPCALVISTPVSVVAAIGNASRHGVLIKGGAYLEHAGTLRAVAFDKTGTLTRGVPEVQRVVPLNGVPAADVLRLAAAVESRSEHPLAAAILRAARRDGLDGLPPPKQFRATPGRGVEATVAGARLLVGKPRWLEAQGVSLGVAGPVLEELAAGGETPVVVARARQARGSGSDGEFPASPAGATSGPDDHRSTAVGLGHRESDGLLNLGEVHRSPGGGFAGALDPAGRPNGDGHAGGFEAVGVIAIADELRSTARPTVDALRRSGVRRVVLLTGDNAATARAVAAQAGIAPEDVRAELLPEHKAAAVAALVREHGAVAMVGDGVNDAPALATATVGIAMGAGGSDAALQTADIALVADDLTRLPWVLQLSRQAAWTIRANVAFALLSKLVVLGLAAAGIANLWLAIAADTGASILVILNGMRLLGNLPLPPAADANRLRQRYGLAEEDEHAGHGGHGHTRHGEAQQGPAQHDHTPPHAGVSSPTEHSHAGHAHPAHDGHDQHHMPGVRAAGERPHRRP